MYLITHSVPLKIPSVDLQGNEERFPNRIIKPKLQENRSRSQLGQIVYIMLRVLDCHDETAIQHTREIIYSWITLTNYQRIIFVEPFRSICPPQPFNNMWKPTYWPSCAGWMLVLKGHFKSWRSPVSNLRRNLIDFDFCLILPWHKVNLRKT